jgi:hypothetical protein
VTCLKLVIHSCATSSAALHIIEPKSVLYRNSAELFARPMQRHLRREESAAKHHGMEYVRDPKLRSGRPGYPVSENRSVKVARRGLDYRPHLSLPLGFFLMLGRRPAIGYRRSVSLSPHQSRMKIANTLATRIMLSMETDSSMP